MKWNDYSTMAKNRGFEIRKIGNMKIEIKSLSLEKDIYKGMEISSSVIKDWDDNIPIEDWLNEAEYTKNIIKKFIPYAKEIRQRNGYKKILISQEGIDFWYNSYHLHVDHNLNPKIFLYCFGLYTKEGLKGIIKNVEKEEEKFKITIKDVNDKLIEQRK